MRKTIKYITSRLSYFAKSSVGIVARLFGLHKRTDGYDGSQLQSAIGVLIVGMLTGILILGIEFPIIIWIAVVFGTLMLVNLDDALMLTAVYAKQGVKQNE